MSSDGFPLAVRLRRSARVATLLVAVTGVPVTGPLFAADVDWSARLAFDERYDDNITELSPRDLRRLDTQGGRNGFPCGSDSTLTQGGRYSIETPGDYVTVPRIATSVRAGWIKGRPSAFDFDFAGHQYVTNAIKNWQVYRLGVSQPLHGGKYGTTIGASFAYSPYQYDRNLRSYSTANELGVLPPPRREATYRSRRSELHVDQVLVPHYLSLRGVVGQEAKNYNKCFNERDSIMPFEQVQLTWEPLGRALLRLRLSFIRENLQGVGDLPDTSFFTEPDISSRRRIISAEARVRWGAKARRTTLGLRYDTEHRDYTAANPNDIYHFERTDERRYATLTARVELPRHWFLSAGAERNTKHSSFPIALAGSSPSEDVTDYTRNIYEVGFGYDFHLAGKQLPANTPGSAGD